MKKRHSLTAYESPLKQRNSCQLTHNTKENVLFFICCAATGVKLNHHITIENASFEYVWYGFTLQKTCLSVIADPLGNYQQSSSLLSYRHWNLTLDIPPKIQANIV